jgi:hypothetical protein
MLNINNTDDVDDHDDFYSIKVEELSFFSESIAIHKSRVILEYYFLWININR